MTPNESPAALLPTIDELTKRQAHDDPVFAAWRDSVPDKHWVKLDLSALRIGYELGRAIATAPDASESRGSVLDGYIVLPREEIERTIKALRYAAHPHRSPHADALAEYLAAPTPPAVSNGEPPDWAIVEVVRDHPYTFKDALRLAKNRARSAAAKGEGQEKPR